MKNIKQKLPRGLTLVEKELEKIIDRYQKEVLSLLFSEKKGFWQKTKYIETVTNTLQIMYSFHVKNKVIFFRFNLLIVLGGIIVESIGCSSKWPVLLFTISDIAFILAYSIGK